MGHDARRDQIRFVLKIKIKYKNKHITIINMNINTAIKRPIFNGRELIQRLNTPGSLAQTVDTMFTSDGTSISPDTEVLSRRLRAIQISDDNAVLVDMSVNMRKIGIFALEDLQGFTLDELKEEVAVLHLNRVQIKKLFDALSNM